MKRLSDLEEQIRPPSQPLPLMSPPPAQSGPETRIRQIPLDASGSTDCGSTRPSPPLEPLANALSLPEASIDRRASVELNNMPGPTMSNGPHSFPSTCSTDHNQVYEPRAGSIHMPATAHYKFNINLAQTNLHAQGVFHAENNDENGDVPITTENSRLASPALQVARSDHPNLDPTWLIPRREALRLSDVYEEEINISHPFLDMRTIRDHVNNLYDSLEILSQNGCTHIPLKDTTIIGPDDLKIVKMVFATALITETSGPSKLAQALFEDVKSSVQERLWEGVNIPTIIIFFLLVR